MLRATEALEQEQDVKPWPEDDIVPCRENGDIGVDTEVVMSLVIAMCSERLGDAALRLLGELLLSFRVRGRPARRAGL